MRVNFIGSGLSPGRRAAWGRHPIHLAPVQRGRPPTAVLTSFTARSRGRRPCRGFRHGMCRRSAAPVFRAPATPDASAWGSCAPRPWRTPGAAPLAGPGPLPVRRSDAARIPPAAAPRARLWLSGSAPLPRCCRGRSLPNVCCKARVFGSGIRTAFGCKLFPERHYAVGWCVFLRRARAQHRRQARPACFSRPNGPPALLCLPPR